MQFHRTLVALFCLAFAVSTVLNSGCSSPESDTANEGDATKSSVSGSQSDASSGKLSGSGTKTGSGTKPSSGSGSRSMGSGSRTASPESAQTSDPAVGANADEAHDATGTKGGDEATTDVSGPAIENTSDQASAGDEANADATSHAESNSQPQIQDSDPASLEGPLPPEKHSADSDESTTTQAADNVVAQVETTDTPDENPSGEIKKIVKTDVEWRRQLTKNQFYVTREHGTERAFTGRYWDNKQAGTYKCICCGLPLFASDTKYKSGTGWPSFWDKIEPQNVGESIDRSFFSVRTEVHCNRCNAHLGHVFDDGPRPTGLRYCINSASLKFEAKAKKDAAEAEKK